MGHRVTTPIAKAGTDLRDRSYGVNNNYPCTQILSALLCVRQLQRSLDMRRRLEQEVEDLRKLCPTPLSLATEETETDSTANTTVDRRCLRRVEDVRRELQLQKQIGKTQASERLPLTACLLCCNADGDDQTEAADG